MEIEKLIKDKNLPTVAIIAPDSLPVPPVLGGSIQTIIYDYTKLLKGLNVVVISKKAGGLPKYQRDEHGVGHIHISSRSFESLELKWGNDFLFRWNLYIYRACWELKKLAPQVVHVHNRPHWIPIIRKILGSKVKIIMTNHNQKIAEDNYVLKKMAKIIPEIDLAVYPSRRIAELDLLEKFPQCGAKTEIIYNCVETEKFKKVSTAQQALVREKYKLGKSKVLLFVGRLVKEKAIDKILEALPLVLKEEKDVKLLIAGSSFFAGAQDTPFIKKLKELAEPIKQSVIFTGFIDNDNLPELYSAADIFVSPVNWDDPSPKTIYEAAACECPIISTKRGGIPEIVEDGSSAVLLDSPYEPEELAVAIVSLLRDPEAAQLLACNARIRMQEKYTPTKVAKNWQTQYLKMADN